MQRRVLHAIQLDVPLVSRKYADRGRDALRGQLDLCRSYHQCLPQRDNKRDDRTGSDEWLRENDSRGEAHGRGHPAPHEPAGIQPLRGRAGPDDGFIRPGQQITVRLRGHADKMRRIRPLGEPRLALPGFASYFQSCGVRGFCPWGHSWHWRSSAARRPTAAA